MVVSISGYNWSGSSAVMDLLKEYGETRVIDAPEWYIIDQPDGIRDLAFHVLGTGTYLSSDVAVARFLRFVDAHDDYARATGGQFSKLSSKYIQGIVQAQWDGHSSYDGFRLPPVGKALWKIRNYLGVGLSKATHRNVCLVDRKMYLCVQPEKFYEKTKWYINQLLYAAGGGIGKVNVVKQLFPANNPVPDFAFVDNPYAVLVDRDPRDIYALCKNLKVACFPCQDVRAYVTYYKAWRMDRTWLGHPRVLRVQFEDLDYHYEETVKQIEAFLNIHDHKYPKRYFDPKTSIKTTKIYKKYPKLSDEIRYIEDQLGEYLYDG